AVHAFKQHDVDLGQQLVDRSNDFDVHLFEFRDKGGDAVGTFLWNVRAAAREGRNDFHATDVAGGIGAVEFFCEGGDVRGVAADDASLQVGGMDLDDKHTQHCRDQKCSHCFF